MINHFHIQAMSDAISGACTHSFVETSIVWSYDRLRAHTALCYCSISLNKLTFSDN
jgi:hypothetical protein